MSPEKVLMEKYNLEIPAQPTLQAPYKPVVQTGNLLYVSGQTPKENGKLSYQGKLGNDLTIEQGKQASIVAIINCLAAIKSQIDDVDQIKQFVQLMGFVNSNEGFHEQSKIINPASQLLQDVFGDKGEHSRYAIGVQELPGGAPVEIACIVEV